MDAFTIYVAADVVGVVIALAVYDYLVDDLLDRLLKVVRRKFLERQGVS